MTSRKLNRRQFLAFAGAVSSAAALAACAPQQPAATEPPKAEEPTKAPAAEEPTKAPEAEAPAAERKVVEFLGWPGDVETPEEKDKFEAGFPQFELKYVAQQEGVQLLALIAAGTPPDGARVESNVYRSFAKSDALLEITDQVRADPLLGKKDYFIEPQETERCAVDGKWYGIGSCWVAPHLYFNADIFTEEGIDPPSNDPEKAWDWATFLDVARKLTKDVNGKHPGEEGFDANNVDRYGIDWPTWWIPMHAAIQSNEGAWIDAKSGKIVLDTPEATEAMQNIADLTLVHQVKPTSTAMEGLGMSNTQMLENKKLAMAVDGSWALAWMYEMKGKLGTAVLPKMKRPATDMQAHLHVVVKGAKNPEGGWATVKFLSEDWFQEKYLRSGLWLPSHTSLMTAEAIARWCVGPVHPEGYEMIVTQYAPKYGHFLTMPIGYQKAADSVLTPAMDQIWTGEAKAADAMAVVPDANQIMADEQSR